MMTVLLARVCGCASPNEGEPKRWTDPSGFRFARVRDAPRGSDGGSDCEKPIHRKSLFFAEGRDQYAWWGQSFDLQQHLALAQSLTKNRSNSFQ
jgi:hypothetical protein